ncbi:Arylsulfatase [Planctomycetes bacterium Poly30]|uniref:Arylsulfatase n=1 Tax=Saltatorellus ferox TaxID=2528018 RepID=A0A518EV30_9BACT|nr:Arylsulfatase [Planctomycetes bacterium Poly30]
MRFPSLIGQALLALMYVGPLMFVGMAAGCKGEEPGTSGSKGSPVRPNLLLLVSDDQGTALGCYPDGWGEGVVQTPRLDALAARGVRFTRAYAPSAVCTPSRSSIYTGLMPAHHGATGFEAVRPDVKVWGTWFAEAGYRTGLIGKIGAKPIAGFPFDFIARSLKEDEDARSLEWHVEELDAFLAQDDGRPWVLVVNFRDSHWPFPTDGAPYGDSSVEPHDPAKVRVPATLFDAPEVRGEIARFYDGLRRMDATVGAVVDRLASRDLGPSTIGMFTSDNGPPFPFAKTTLYEAGIHMPLIAWGSGVPAGATSDAFVSLVDLLPTFLDLGGKAAPLDAFDGRSFAHLVSGREAPATPWPDAIFATHDTHRVDPDIPSRSVRFGNWKYIRSWSEGLRFENLVMRTSDTWRAMALAADGGNVDLAARMTTFVLRPGEELFDLADDPSELNNLARSEAYAEPLDEARRRLRETRMVTMPTRD